MSAKGEAGQKSELTCPTADQRTTLSVSLALLQDFEAVEAVVILGLARRERACAINGLRRCTWQAEELVRV